MRNQDKYLQQRNDGRWHYARRVPEKYANFDKRGYVRKGLDTNSIDVARMRRDDLVKADDLYWASVSSAADELSASSLNAEQTKQAMRRYEAAKRRAMAKGFEYTPNADLLEFPDMEELVRRVKSLPANVVPDKVDAEAVLGIAPKPSVTLTQAFDIYCDKIEMAEMLGKSEAQKRDWRKIKYRSILNFVDLRGDMAMDKITRTEARAFYNWWGQRLLPQGNEKARKPNTANRDLGNLRKLFRKYWEYEGEEGRENPFRNLNFTETKGKDVPHFENEWVQDNILKPEVFNLLNRDAILIIYALIETGCRPSEIMNLLPENIVLENEVPHIRIRRQDNRQLKTSSSIRDIPLVGVSLIAMQQAKSGFPRYHDKTNLFSVSMLKAFRRRKLFPTENHRIYSFRHSFEKRMLEGGLDHDLRCLLMGHKNPRPQYGDGGSLAYRRDELLKIVHPIPTDFEKRLSEVCFEDSK
jgi:integrase